MNDPRGRPPRQRTTRGRATRPPPTPRPPSYLVMPRAVRPAAGRASLRGHARAEQRRQLGGLRLRLDLHVVARIDGVARRVARTHLDLCKCGGRRLALGARGGWGAGGAWARGGGAGGGVEGGGGGGWRFRDFGILEFMHLGFGNLGIWGSGLESLGGVQVSGSRV